MIQKILLFLLLTAPAIIQAQTSLSEQQIIHQNETLFPMTNQPSSVFATDLDGDGDMDVLSASAGDHKIAWYENTDGAGTFSSQNIITTSAEGALSVYADDLDGDGDMDVLSASEADDKIAWYENTDGSGTFSDQIVITTAAEGAQSVYTADVDGDGDMDVLSASFRRYPSGRSDNKVAWYENTDGAGTFGSQNVISTRTGNPIAVKAADLDEDGDSDLLCAFDSWHNQIVWFENDGAGSFGEEQIISDSADDIQDVCAADLNGDRHPDVLFATYPYSGTGNIAWQQNDGAGNFGEQNIIIESDALSVYAADLDADGDMDIISGLKNDEIIWHQNDGNGNFGEPHVITDSADDAQAVYAADLNGDGYSDVLSASLNDHKISWYPNDASGHFGSQQNITWYHDVQPEFASAADLDNDGDMDVLAAYTIDDKLVWYENTGNGNFSGQKMITSELNHPTIVKTADFDGDGDADILSVSHVTYRDMIVVGSPGDVMWIENKGNGSFGEPQNVNDSVYSRILVCSADMDGDGDPDVLSASRKQIAWYENTDGGGTFGPQTEISTEPTTRDITTADLNGDGYPDVIVATDDKIMWYQNNSSGSIGGEQVITTGELGASAVCPCDPDRDGDIDILYTSADDDDDMIGWLENTDGSGTFGSEHVITTGFVKPTGIAAVDLDNDTDLDAVYISEIGDNISWQENDGSGNFSNQQLITSAADGVCSISAVDLDDDGDMDLLSASAEDDKIAWYENLYEMIDVEETDQSIPAKFRLAQNYPNPFNPVTTIEFSLKNNAHTKLTVYNTIGEKVATLVNAFYRSGNYRLHFDASNLPSGTYIYKIETGSFSASRKMVLLR